MDRSEIKNPGLARTILRGLASQCPMGDVTECCPLRDKRGLPYSEKVAWLKSMTDTELLSTYSEHCNCLAVKEVS